MNPALVTCCAVAQSVVALAVNNSAEDKED